jgi:hypothetical protein
MAGMLTSSDNSTVTHFAIATLVLLLAWSIVDCPNENATQNAIRGQTIYLTPC